MRHKSVLIEVQVSDSEYCWERGGGVCRWLDGNNQCKQEFHCKFNEDQDKILKPNECLELVEGE